MPPEIPEEGRDHRVIQRVLEVLGGLLQEVYSCIAYIDREGIIRGWPSSSERLFGYPAEGVVGRMRLPQLFQRAEEGEKFLRELKGRSKAETTAELMRVTGATFPARLIFSTAAQEDHYIGVITDISDKEQTRENINYLRVYLDTVLAISGDAIITADLDGVIMMFNEGAERIFRLPGLEALGEDMFTLLFPQEDIPAIKEQLRTVGHIRDREVKLRFPDGEEIFLEVSVTKTRDARGQEAALIAIIRDITTRKRLEEERLQNERVQQEMRIARGVQLTMLPDRPPKIEGMDIAARIEFCADIGGDLFDFSRPRSGKLGVSIGDVSAHGVGPAIVMSSAKAMLNTLEQYTEDPEHMMYLLNNLLERTTEDDRFITMFYALIDTNERTMEYVNAGHDPPIIYRPDRGVFEELQSTGLALGILPGERFRLGPKVHFNKNDLMLLTTDGIWEATNPEGEAFGKHRIYDILRECHHLPSQAILDELFRRVKEFCRGEPARDDQTAVLFKFL
ncbi:MAG: SpoIIE family protein phosphatase [Thermoguttaceae bacterium]|nr:SpoIIE family protein phosphatase [Thermoguttaceae bacterium]MDW8078359.1 SpoIIE family protein phosphatase [Thermoguttaceae bacterium]